MKLTNKITIYISKKQMSIIGCKMSHRHIVIDHIFEQEIQK